MEQLDEMFIYLDKLLESGKTNVLGFGVSPYLQSEYGLDRRDAKKVLLEWIRTRTVTQPSPSC